MSDLWGLFRSTWPGILPDRMPTGLGMSKVIVRRARYFDPDPACLQIVLVGKVAERISSHTGKEAVVRVYESREIILPRAGFLYTEDKTHLLQLEPGWEMVLPEVQALAQMHACAELLEIKRRFASAQVDSVQQRVAHFIREHGLDPATACRSEIGRRVGCTRSMASRVIKQMMEDA